MNKKIIAGGTLVLLLACAGIAIAGELVGPLGSLKLDKAPKTAEQSASVQPVKASPASAPVAPAALAVPAMAPVAKSPAIPSKVVSIASVPAQPAPGVTRQAPPAKPVQAAPVALAVPKAAAQPTVQPTAPRAAPAAAKPVAAPVAAAAATAVAPVVASTAPPVPAAPVSVSAPLQPAPVSGSPRRIKQVQLDPREVSYQEQEADLARQIRIVQMQVTLRELQKKLVEDSAPAADSAVLPPPPPVQSVLDIPEEPVVRLISVWGDPSKLTADVLARGVRTSVKAGDPLPEGWRVVEVGRNSLLIQRGRTKNLVKIGG